MLDDLRYAVRRLRKNPGYAAAEVLALALGIGCTTAIFSVMQAVLLRTLPFPDADQLVFLSEDQPGGPGASLSGPDFVDLGAQGRSFGAPLAAALRRRPARRRTHADGERRAAHRRRRPRFRFVAAAAA